jgi:hypothetical protein
MKIQVRLLGTLRKHCQGYDPRSGVEVDVHTEARVVDIVEIQGLPEDRTDFVEALFSSVLGIAFFFLTDPEAILMDGRFSFVGFGVRSLTMCVACLVLRLDDAREHSVRGSGTSPREGPDGWRPRPGRCSVLT